MSPALNVPIRVDGVEAARSIIERLVAELAEARAERDEWEKKYDALLSDIGGVSPG